MKHGHPQDYSQTCEFCNEETITITRKQFFDAAYVTFGIHGRAPLVSISSDANTSSLGFNPNMGSAASVVCDMKFGDMAKKLGFTIPDEENIRKSQQAFLDGLRSK
jgi:hypothetical protein